MKIRAEGLHEPLTSEFAPGFVYYGLRCYRSGYTNDGNLLGNWVGRAGERGAGLDKPIGSLPRLKRSGWISPAGSSASSSEEADWQIIRQPGIL